MSTTQKLALLQRLLDQAAEVRTQNSDDPTFKTWKNTVERTLIRVFGSDSPEVKQFSELRFFYHTSVWDMSKDYSNDHRQSFQNHFQIVISSIENYIEELKQYPDDDDILVATDSTSKVAKVFISHASQDAHYVEELVECLEVIGLPAERIFCTSLEGYGIDLGDNFLDAIKEELNNETLVLFVLTKNFYARPICLCEMGAAWALSKEHIPILVPPFDFDDVKGVIPLTQGFKINEPLKLNLFKEKLESLLRLSPASSVSAWERKRDRIVARIEEKIALDAAKSA